MWKKYNPNPKEARTGDCVVRALCKAMDKPWEEIYIDLSAEGLRRCDMPSANHVWSAYLRHNGFKKHILPDTCPDCYTVEKFSKDFYRGTFIVALQNHLVCVKDGDIFDTWDSSKEIPLYYFKKEK